MEKRKLCNNRKIQRERETERRKREKKTHDKDTHFKNRTPSQFNSIEWDLVSRNDHV